MKRFRLWATPAAAEAELVRGVKRYPDGSRYEGEHQRLYGGPHGEGVMTWPDGRRYEGEFRERTMHGEGVMTWPDGSRYEGEFRDGRMRGEGVMTLADGGCLVGEFRDGWLYEGVGTYPEGGRLARISHQGVE